ncbi:MFS transporter [Kitasatospora sp. NPDC054939]
MTRIQTRDSGVRPEAAAGAPGPAAPAAPAKGAAAAVLDREPEPLVPLRRNRDFTKLWIGAGVSRYGATVGMVANPMLVLWHSGSGTSTGLVTFAATLPSLLVQLPAGALVDRWDRKRTMIICDVLGLLAVLCVALAAFKGWIFLPLIMASSFIGSALAIFYQLAEQASVRRVVRTEQLPAALSQNEARGAAIGLLGQPLSGFLFNLARWLPFVFTAVANLVALACLVLIRKDLRPIRSPERQALHLDIREGAVWLWRRRFLRIMMVLFASTNVVFQVLGVSIMVIVHQTGGSAATLGTVLAVGGVGGLLGALAARPWQQRYGLYPTAVFGLAAWTLLIPLAVTLRDPVAIAATLAGIWFVGALFNVTAAVYQTRTTPDELQGRVTGVSRFLSSGANALGALAGGVLLDRVGTGWIGLGMAVVLIALTAYVASSRTVRAESRAAGEDRTARSGGATAGPAQEPEDGSEPEAAAEQAAAEQAEPEQASSDDADDEQTDPDRPDPEQPASAQPEGGTAGAEESARPAAADRRTPTTTEVTT